MNKGFKDFDVMARQLDDILAHIRDCNNTPDPEHWSSEGFKKTIDILGDIETNIEINLDIIRDVGCDCPVCIAAKRHIVDCKNYVADLRSRMLKYTSGSQKPLEAMLLLGTTTNMLVTVPSLIEAMSDLALQAHAFVRTIVESKIVGISVEKNSDNPKDGEPGEEPN